MNKETQRKKIIDFITENGSITVRDAFVKLNINSPTKRISEIIRNGEARIMKERNSRINTYGETIYYTVYSFKS